MSWFKKIFGDTPGSHPRLMNNASDLGDAVEHCDELRRLVRTMRAAEKRLRAEGGGIDSEAYRLWAKSHGAFTMHLAQHHGWLPSNPADLEALEVALGGVAG